MTVKVKICGVRTPVILDAAVSNGADLVGLVFFPKSPRHVTISQARALADAARGRVRTVAVLVDPEDALIDRVSADVQPDILQFHGHESPERLATIKARTGLPVFKGVPVSQDSDVASASGYAGIADLIVFDTKAPPGAELPGGNGVAFDWSLLGAAPQPFALSGGLEASNVAEAIRLTGASLVDVSSGVETAPGEKDGRLISDFIQAAKSAKSQQPAKSQQKDRAQHKKAS